MAALLRPRDLFRITLDSRFSWQLCFFCVTRMAVALPVRELHVTDWPPVGAAEAGSRGLRQSAPREIRSTLGRRGPTRPGIADSGDRFRRQRKVDPVPKSRPPAESSPRSARRYVLGSLLVAARPGSLSVPAD